jgi:tRNA-splicing endonuclease subunit Sen2
MIIDKEHLQLAPEEAFFLAFALGALHVVNGETHKHLSTRDLLRLLRQYSYFPPRIPTGADPSSASLSPDDPFLIHYAVYHHFRSLGWVPRPGMKFGVDWLLYFRGPVFDHAEFGLVVMPSFSAPEWKEKGKKVPTRSWHWLSGTNRLLSHVFKSLVLVYVDVPPPSLFEGIDDPADGLGIAGRLRRYKVHEVVVKRWSPNRNRTAK